MAHAATPHTQYHAWGWRQEIERLRRLGAPIDEPPLLDLNRLTKRFVRDEASHILSRNPGITPSRFARLFIRKHGCAPNVETLLFKCPWFLEVFSDVKLRARRQLAKTNSRAFS